VEYKGAASLLLGSQLVDIETSAWFSLVGVSVLTWLGSV